MLSDQWDGLDLFFEPKREVLLVRNTEDVVQALSLSDTELRDVAEAGRQRVLAQRTADHRAIELESIYSRLFYRVSPAHEALSRA